MMTCSSPGWLAHDRTRELCTQSSPPGTALESSRGYWNSPAAHTTNRVRSVAACAPSAPPVATCTSKAPSTRSIWSTSVRSLTSSFASVASAFKYSAYCVPDGCCACSENAGDVPWAMELRSNDPVQPC